MAATAPVQHLGVQSARFLVALLLAAFALAPRPVLARGKPVDLKLQVRAGKAKLGKDQLRVTQAEGGTYYSTTAQLTEGGRHFTQRSHTVVTPLGVLSTCDRWIDVKGTTARWRVYAYQDAWKLVRFPMPNTRDKPKVVDLKVKEPLIVLDERLPTLVVVAVLRMEPHLNGAGEAAFDFVRIDDGVTGRMQMKRERVRDAAGGPTFTRWSLDSDKLHLEVLQRAEGETVYVKGIGDVFGIAGDFKVPRKLAVVADEGGAAPTAPSADSGTAVPSEKAPAAKPVEKAPAAKPVERAPADKPAERAPADKPGDEAPVDKAAAAEAAD